MGHISLSTGDGGAAMSSKTLVSYCITMWCHITEDHDMNHHHENLKSCIINDTAPL
jgi:hypothetical protein